MTTAIQPTAANVAVRPHELALDATSPISGQSSLARTSKVGLGPVRAFHAERPLVTDPKHALAPIALPQRGVVAEDGDVRFPKNLCYGGQCSEAMEKLWGQFEASNHGIDPSTLPEVMSGPTYFLWGWTNPAHEHHSGFLLDRVEGKTTFAGSMSFFAPENPYRDLDIEAARAKFQRDGTRGHPMVHRDDHAYADLNPNWRRDGSVPVEYWLRKSPDGENVIVVGFFGNGRFLVGELSPNPKKNPGS